MNAYVLIFVTLNLIAVLSEIEVTKNDGEHLEVIKLEHVLRSLVKRLFNSNDGDDLCIELDQNRTR